MKRHRAFVRVAVQAVASWRAANQLDYYKRVTYDEK